MESSLIKQLFLITDSRNWTKHIRVVDYEVGYDRKMHEILWLVSSLFFLFFPYSLFHFFSPFNVAICPFELGTLSVSSTFAIDLQVSTCKTVKKKIRITTDLF